MEDQIIDKYSKFESIPAMTSGQVQNYLTEIGTKWTGQGTALELGSWLGATSAALLKGLVQAGFNLEYWAFDKWEVTRGQIPKAHDQGFDLRMNQDTEPVFRRNIEPIYRNLMTIKGGMPGTLKQYDGEPIEICIFDAPKQDPIFIESMKALIPYFIPGVTILGLLDYKFYERHKGHKRNLFAAPVRFMEKYSDYFELYKSWPDECPTFFRYKKKLVF